MITKDTTIEELINMIPTAATYLSEQGIRCIRCGEPIWGTLGEAAEEKSYSTEQIEIFVQDLNNLLQNPPAEDMKFEKRFDVTKLKL
jgi:hypothetical protein